MNKNLLYGFILILIFIAAFVYLSMPKDASNPIADLAKKYCGARDVSAVYACKDMAQILYAPLGAGSTYIKPDGTSVNCPLVSPDSQTPQCLELYKLKCDKVC
ncbi:hypothetical protein HY989_00495 [Candidatus Micrarchaeota archaeon]|nr:hypothetical protein [Candidatus Micrarchaeota archaeon]